MLQTAKRPKTSRLRGHIRSHGSQVAISPRNRDSASRRESSFWGSLRRRDVEKKRPLQFGEAAWSRQQKAELPAKVRVTGESDRRGQNGGRRPARGRLRSR